MLNLILERMDAETPVQQCITDLKPFLDDETEVGIEMEIGRSIIKIGRSSVSV